MTEGSLFLTLLMLEVEYSGFLGQYGFDGISCNDEQYCGDNQCGAICKVVSFLRNRHPIPHPRGWGMGCHLWGQTLIYVMQSVTIVLYTIPCNIGPRYNNTKLYMAEQCGESQAQLYHINGLVQERRSSSALAMELGLSWINPSIFWTSVLF